MLQPWQTFLQRFDMFGTLDSDCGPRGILVAGDFQKNEGTCLEATMFQPEGISSKATLCDRLNYSKDVPFQTVSLLWDVNLSMPEKDEKFFFMNVEQIAAGNTPVFRVDHLTVPVPIIQGSTDRIKVLELFSGGYGGWSAACKYLSVVHGSNFQVVGVERDIDAAFSFAIARDAQIWNGEVSLPSHAITEAKSDVVLCASVQSMSWVPCVAQWSPDCLCISAPCQPWSSAGSGQGLLSEDGECLMQAMALAKLLRPRFILLEQVAAFMTHPHKAHVLSLIRWAGFCLRWNKLVDLAEQCPTHRVRWLALAERVANMPQDAIPFQYWKVQEKVVPSSYGSILAKDLTLDERLTLNEHVLRLSSRVDLLPPGKRRCMTADDVLMARCYNMHQCLPTFMASYGSQHMFSEQWLANKGLLSHFYIDPEGCKRLWHPIEVLLHHGVCTTQFVHGDWSLAWLHAGNQIATPHALLLLTNMLRMMHLPYTPDVPNVLQGFFESHITADSLCIVQCSKGQIISAEPVGWTESQFASIDNFHECLKDGNVPPGLSWSIDGLHPLQLQMPKAIPAASGTTGIEATCPFYATLTAAFTSSKAFFEFDYDQEVSCNTLLCVWDHAMTVHQDASQLVLQPNMTWTGQDETNPKVLIFAAANGIRILKPERESLNKAVPGVTVFFDQFGPISHMSFDKTVIVYEQNPCPTIPEWNQTAAKFVMAMNQCQTYVHIDPLAHDMHLTFQGPHACVATVVNFWQCVVGRDFMKHVGLSMQCTSNKAGATIKMVYDEGRCPLPFTGLKIQLVVFAARALFAKLENAHGKLVRIKWMARPLWQGRLPAATTGATILQILHAVTMIHTGSIKYRMICNGKRFVDERTLGDLNHDGQTPVTIHTVLQLHGGGPPGTKQSLKIQTKNAFASMLLEEGFELTWIGQALDTMMQKAPAKDVNEIFHMTAGPQKLQCLLEVLKQCDTQIPKIKPALSSQAAANAKRKKFPTLPQPDQYAVVPGSLLNEDGSEACQTLEFGCQVTGFYVATQQFAVPWLRTGEKIAADELAMLIMGDLPLETALPTNKVTLPFRDEKGRDVLIACNLIQFGEKSIIPKELDPHLIASDNTSLMAITLWQQDWEEQWSSICEEQHRK